MCSVFILILFFVQHSGHLIFKSILFFFYFGTKTIYLLGNNHHLSFLLIFSAQYFQLESSSEKKLINISEKTFIFWLEMIYFSILAPVESCLVVIMILILRGIVFQGVLDHLSCKIRLDLYLSSHSKMIFDACWWK